MNNTSHNWTLDGFVEHFDFVHHRMLDHKFVWVLGAGASCASGIPLGSELVDRWLAELHLREGGTATSLEQWATQDTLEIVNFTWEERAAFYTKIYERRFREYPEEGYAYLEGLMSGKDPSPGYSVLAAALASQPPRHNVVITTNFDNLIADALSIYTDTFPFVCGHESLTAFVRIAMRRPLICKIHRDLLLAPQNDPRSLRRLHDSWGTALRALFQHYTPLFIGYGGNDDTLMDLLESMQPGDIKGQMIWCYHEGGKPSDRIVNVISDHKGVLVPVPDFDLLMVLLGARMAISLLDEEIGTRAEKRTQQYRERIQRLDSVKHPAVAKALAATFDRSGGWWAWEQKARLEKDRQRREIVYRQALQHCPRSPEIRHVFADFLKDRNPDEAEKLHKAAVDLNPKDASSTGRLATFLAKVRGDKPGAEKLWQAALEMDRKAVTLGFGYFLWEDQRKIKDAARYFEETVQLHPKNAACIGALAHFRWQGQGDFEAAEKSFRSALSVDSRNPNVAGNYACFLLARGRLGEAETYVKIARAANHGNTDQLAAELALYDLILAKEKGRDASSALARLRSVFAEDFERVGWNFDDLLGSLRTRVSRQDLLLFSRIADGILDENRVPDLTLQKRVTVGESSNGTRPRQRSRSRARNGDRRIKSASKRKTHSTKKKS